MFTIRSFSNEQVEPLTETIAFCEDSAKCLFAMYKTVYIGLRACYLYDQGGNILDFSTIEGEI